MFFVLYGEMFQSLFHSTKKKKSLNNKIGFCGHRACYIKPGHSQTDHFVTVTVNIS